MRPVMPSRRNEKNLERSSTVHQSPPLTWATPARSSRSQPAQTGRRASAPNCRVPPGPRSAADRHRAFLAESAARRPTSNCAARCRGHRYRWGRHRPRLRRRPAASPRPRRRPGFASRQAVDRAASGRERHRQAVRHLHGAGDAGFAGPGRVGSFGSPPSSTASARSTVQPCTWRSHAVRHRSARRSDGGSRSRRLISDRDEVPGLFHGATLAPPAHVLISAPTCAAAAHCGRSQGSERIRTGFGTCLAPPVAGVEHAHHVRHVVGAAVEALRIEDLRHQRAIGQRRRVAMAEARRLRRQLPLHRFQAGFDPVAVPAILVLVTDLQRLRQVPAVRAGCSEDGSRRRHPARSPARGRA